MMNFFYSVINEIIDLVLTLISIIWSIVFVIFMFIAPVLVIYNFEYIGFFSLIVPLFLFRVYLKTAQH